MSILRNAINYVQYNRNLRDYFKLDIRELEKRNHGKVYDMLIEEDRQFIELDFGDLPDKLKEKYLDMYD